MPAAAGSTRLTDTTISTRQAASAAAVAAAYEELEGSRAAARIWARDHTLWKDDPTEISDRLGWLDIAGEMKSAVPGLRSFAAEVKDAGIENVVLLGMGGSSLGPEVLRGAFGSAPGFPELNVLDSTLPATVLSVERGIDTAHTLFLVSSKSGATIEPLVLYAHFRELVEQAVGQGAAGDHFVAVTDPATPLAAMGADEGFREVFEARADIGGRYSVLSHFGMVPAALIGIDIERVLDSAIASRDAAERVGLPAETPGVNLGGFIGGLARAGRDKLSVVAGPPYSSLGLWIEQLIAESTGKEGAGVVPVAGEPMAGPEAFEEDRAFVLVDGGDPAAAAHAQRLSEAGHPVFTRTATDPHEVGALFFEWELAIAVVGAQLGINPFDQPNVQAAKDATDRVLGGFEQTGSLPPLEDAGSLAGLLSQAGVGDYLATMAYLPQTRELADELGRLRQRVMEKHRIATTLGYGPRFLHSTGQLHKGGPNSGLFLQITEDHSEDAAIPGRPYTFATLVDAQAIGDYEALSSAGRRVARLRLGEDAAGAVRKLAESV